MRTTKGPATDSLVRPADPRQFDGAACARRDPRIFDDFVPGETPAEQRRRLRQAAKACDECPVESAQCLAFGLRNDLDGWFGGGLLTAESRKVLRRSARA